MHRALPVARLRVRPSSFARCRALVGPAGLEADRRPGHVLDRNNLPATPPS
jgi:hypothetical protein